MGTRPSFCATGLPVDATELLFDATELLFDATDVRLEDAPVDRCLSWASEELMMPGFVSLGVDVRCMAGVQVEHVR